MSRVDQHASRALTLLLAAVFTVTTLALAAFTVGVAPTAAGAAAKPATTSSVLGSGGVLGTDQSIVSPNGQYRLVLQGDGNLVHYGPAGPLWASSTSGSGATAAVMQDDGNLVLLRPGAMAVWSLGTSAVARGGGLVLQDDGNLVLYSGGNGPIWSRLGVTGRSALTLFPGQALQPGMWLTSPNGQVRTILQSDGNLVTYRGATALWASNTSGAGAQAVFQGDGNFVVYVAGVPRVQSATGPLAPNASLTLQDDGNLVMYSQGNGPVWSTATGPTSRSGNSLFPGQSLGVGQAIYSPNGAYRAVMQSDGNLVVYTAANRPVWSAGSRGAPLTFSNGGLSAGGWSNGSAGSAANRLFMQDDGNLVLTGPRGAYWSSRTGLLIWPAPPNSGSGRRVVYSNPRQRVWWIDENNEVVRTYLVSGRYATPGGGTYYVYRKAPLAFAGHDGITMKHMVEFAPGGLGIGFHAIPRYADGSPLQSEAQLGSYRSAGCVRQADRDAYALYQWASIGTKVVVIY